MNFLRTSLFQQITRCSAHHVPRCSRSVSSQNFQETQSEETQSKDYQSEEYQSEDYHSEDIPNSPSFFTTRSGYHDQFVLLEKAVAHAKSHLKNNHLLPLPRFARDSLPPVEPVWKGPQEMSALFELKLKTSRYRKVVKILNQLNECLRISNVGGFTELSLKLQDILALYERDSKAAILNRGKKKPVVLDTYGRSYTLGKRKTSSARVWLIRVPEKERVTSLADILEVPEAEPTKYPVTTTTILVNNLPLNQFFFNSMDRERITRPLKVAGVLGKYNIFTLVRGGGSSGQAGAIAQGIAKGIVAHEPELEVMFRRAKLTWRDPRMVERKKTGLAKARKAYSWVKR